MSSLKKELKNITKTMFSIKNNKKDNLLKKLHLSDDNIMREDSNEFNEFNENSFNNQDGGSKQSRNRYVSNRYNTKSFIRSEKSKLSRMKDDNDENDDMKNLDRQRRMGRTIETYDYEEVDLENHKYPFVMKIKKHKILNNKFDYNIQNGISYAKSSLSFHHWIHASHNKNLEYEKFVGKKKVYNIVNAYERKIDEYSLGIDDMIEKEFKTNVRSRKYSRILELLMYFNIADEKNLNGLFIDSTPSNIIQPVMDFRKHYFNGKDKFVGVQSQGETFNDNEDDNEDTSKLNGKNISMNGSLKDYSSNDKFNLIIGHSGIDWDKNNIQEQSIGLDILRTINICLNNLDKNGNLILRMYETFTKLSIKYLMVLSELFEDVHIIKPLTSRNSEGEKYVICQNFKSNDKFKKELNSKINLIESKCNYSKRVMIEDIFTDIKIPNELFVRMISYNSLVINQHYKTVNKIMEFIDGLNYHGELYAYYRDRQIELSQYWNSTFLGKKIVNIRKDTSKLINDGLEDVKLQINEFSDNLIGYDSGKKISRNV
jgi:hypothetical protein